MSELTAALATIEELRAERDQLAAENVGLRETIDAVRGVADNSSGIAGYHLNGDIAKWSEILPEIDDLETPATDAEIAGIKADGVEWTEGAEPSEFGRYWVRYETDVGPQYCSAKWMEYNFCASSDTNIHKIWLADHSRSINSLKGVTHYTKLPAALEGGAL